MIHDFGHNMPKRHVELNRQRIAELIERDPPVTYEDHAQHSLLAALAFQSSSELSLGDQTFADQYVSESTGHDFFNPATALTWFKTLVRFVVVLDHRPGGSLDAAPLQHPLQLLHQDGRIVGRDQVVAGAGAKCPFHLVEVRGR